MWYRHGDVRYGTGTEVVRCGTGMEMLGMVQARRL